MRQMLWIPWPLFPGPSVNAAPSEVGFHGKPWAIYMEIIEMMIFHSFSRIIIQWMDWIRLNLWFVGGFWVSTIAPFIEATTLPSSKLILPPCQRQSWLWQPYSRSPFFPTSTLYTHHNVSCLWESPLAMLLHAHLGPRKQWKTPVLSLIYSP